MVFCTIHQPGMTLYNIFSHVILMADGRSVYFGTLRNATDFSEKIIGALQTTTSPNIT
ncbi:PREDICTED: protein white-like isoform X2 [Trachymyrmex septentrionalis]|uniref:protein white-like isoform X2 n=1 Tax=Trachymyrmex septentrionalis TaxID=34720 RepID=UPI00084EDDA4|nr:PREDICTED: protein white-like isoform X2 [Trachymyrmex septentrionalis]